MKTVTRILSLAALALAPLGAAHAMQQSASLRCGIVNPTGFVNYVEEHKPTLVELKADFSCLTIIMPGQATTLEYRHDNSRFYAKTDEYGRIVGGGFN
ncbi:hypothetical protein C8J98_105215 [Luteibacter sp. OK325]|uniref:hypothetical protein n=1 Tax=Luteibacter sp. OK325 TaxID=2135670 RepID=UPI000D3D0A7A|nr:hypothetical protein [Luteibacter sp. OK325]PTR32661.1 hypothetical protein C8J98_105215 [Luteibacter sp. OK325]